MKQTIDLSKKNVLVLGGTGKTGSRVARLLQAKGVHVRIGSRNASPAFDWENSATWPAALQGMDAVYISFQPDLAVPGATDTIRNFAETAIKSGVQHLVLLSGRGEKEAEECEQLIMQAGAGWTILRASWFNQNFSEGSFLDLIRAGHVALPVSNTGEPFIDADDIAEVAVAALTENGHLSRLYELTGPRLLTFAEAVGEIAQVLGRPIVFEQIAPDAYVNMLTSYGVPAEYISLLNYLFSEVLDGRNAHITDGVQQALGRKPKDFSQYVRETLATGVWA